MIATAIKIIMKSQSFSRVLRPSFMWYLFVIVYLNIQYCSEATSLEESTMSLNAAKTFMYFAYGSNLWSKRIHIQNPTAVRRNIGKLKNYKLDFLTQSKNWNGASATIVEDNDNNVWGAIWEIDMSNMDDLDRQEGVEENFYKILTKLIETPTGEQIECRLYQQVNNPQDLVEFKNIPIERQPSKTYLNVMWQGAEESNLPSDYIENLKKIPHNGNNSSDVLLKQLGWS